MNCNKLKDKLSAKDAEIKARNENTIHYFNLIKDDVLDMFIDNAISSEFSDSGRGLHKECVIKIMAEKKDVDAGVPFSYRFLSSDFWDIDSYRKKYSLDGVEHFQLIDIFGNMDFEKLKALLQNHLINNGFSYLWITNIWGQRVKTNSFITSRKSLEKACCSNKDESKKDENVFSGESLGVFIFVWVIIAIFVSYAYFF